MATKYQFILLVLLFGNSKSFDFNIGKVLETTSNVTRTGLQEATAVLNPSKVVNAGSTVVGALSNVTKITYNKLANYSDLSKFPHYGTKWMFLPDADGNPVHITIMQIDITTLTPDLLRIADIDKKITFKLYTRYNQEDGFNLRFDDDSLDKSPYDPKKETKFITHGWLSSGNSTTCITIKDEYLKHFDYNIIIMDWNPIAKSLIYPIPMIRVNPIAKFYAQFLDYLIRRGTDTKRIHLIGHSLGAHVSGLAGQFISKGKLGRVTGLDPALPGFRVLHLLTGGRLSNTNADFVDVIHSCAGILGIDYTAGHVDFYPNDGFPPQPGCTLDKYIEGCSHAKSWEYFRESINRDNVFEAEPCPSWRSFTKGLCREKEMIRMGDPTPRTAKGVYYLKTKEREPFSLRTLRSSIHN